MALHKRIEWGDESNLHKIPFQAFYEFLKTNEYGLSANEAKERIKEFGFNKLSEKKKIPVIIRIISQFKNIFAILLLIGSGFAFISEFLKPGEGSIYIAWALLGVTVLNAIFTFIQEYKTEKIMESFKNIITTKTKVLRDKKEIEIYSTELVPGDVVILEEGDKITADARVIEMFNLKVDHSSLTGENEPQLRSVEATDNKPILSRNMVFSGTLVQTGSGKAVVIATGDATKIGYIAKLTRSVGEPISHLQKDLIAFSKTISYIAVTLGILFFGLGFLVGNTILKNLVFAIGIIVATVPEGLLPTATLTMSLAMRKMAKEKALVKNRDAIETLGCLTVICTDKTGTLTQNDLTVKSLYMNNKLYNYEGQKIVYENQKKEFTDIAGYEEINQILICCNNSKYTRKKMESYGDPTELSLKKFLINFTDIESVENRCKRVYEIPFESSKGYMITANITRMAKKKGYLKGAAEIVINKCDKIFSDGKIKKLSLKEKKKILKINNEQSSKGYRVLGFASKEITKLQKKGDYENVLEKSNYIFYGLVVMYDPPRPEVKEAVAECKKAGIKIIVISGDHPNTVRSIAEQVGIVESKNPTIITGHELKKMTDEELKKIFKNKEILFARSFPEDKLRIVSILQATDQVVAVTGDGVNDAPALKRADVGISMGIMGTEVAKEASDIVLLDDNFATIAKAIRYGRSIYENIQSFIMFILSSNTSQTIPFLLFVALSFMNWPLAITALLILVIDLSVDLLPGISLGVESPSPDIMEEKPRRHNSKLCNKKMIARSYGVQGPLIALFGFFVFFNILFAGGWSFSQGIPAGDNPSYQSAVTGYFTTVVIFQIFNLFACKNARASLLRSGIFKNKFALVAVLSQIVILLVMIFFEPAQIIFGTRPFPIINIIWIIFGGIVLLTIEEFRKYLYRKYGILDIRN